MTEDAADNDSKVNDLIRSISNLVTNHISKIPDRNPLLSAFPTLGRLHQLQANVESNSVRVFAATKPPKEFLILLRGRMNPGCRMTSNLHSMDVYLYQNSEERQTFAYFCAKTMGRPILNLENLTRVLQLDSKEMVKVLMKERVEFASLLFHGLNFVLSEPNFAIAQAIRGHGGYVHDKENLTVPRYFTRGIPRCVFVGVGHQEDEDPGIFRETKLAPYVSEKRVLKALCEDNCIDLKIIASNFKQLPATFDDYDDDNEYNLKNCRNVEEIMRPESGSSTSDVDMEATSSAVGSLGILQEVSPRMDSLSDLGHHYELPANPEPYPDEATPSPPTEPPLQEQHESQSHSALGTDNYGMHVDGAASSQPATSPMMAAPGSSTLDPRQRPSESPQRPQDPTKRRRHDPPFGQMAVHAGNHVMAYGSGQMMASPHSTQSVSYARSQNMSFSQQHVSQSPNFFYLTRPNLEMPSVIRPKFFPNAPINLNYCPICRISEHYTGTYDSMNRNREGFCPHMYANVSNEVAMTAAMQGYHVINYGDEDLQSPRRSVYDVLQFDQSNGLDRSAPQEQLEELEESNYETTPVSSSTNTWLESWSSVDSGPVSMNPTVQPMEEDGWQLPLPPPQAPVLQMDSTDTYTGYVEQQQGMYYNAYDYQMMENTAQGAYNTENSGYIHMESYNGNEMQEDMPGPSIHFNDSFRRME